MDQHQLQQQQQQNPIPTPPPPTTTAAAVDAAASPSTPQLEPQPPPPHSQPQPQPALPQPPSTSALNPNPNPRPALLPPGRPPIALPRPSSSAASAPPRGVGGVALGVPAHRPSPQVQQQTGSFSPSYGHFGGLARSGVGLTESSPSSSASQVRQSIPGMPPGIGMLGSHSSGVQMRAGGIPAHHQPRPVQSSLRPVSSPTNQLPSSQNFQGHGLLRMPSAGAPSLTSPSTPQSVQSLNQPWLASGPQGKPPLPSPSYRQPVTSQSLQPRPQPQPQPQPLLHQQPQIQIQSQPQQSQPQRPQQLQPTHSLPVTSLPQPMPSLQPQQSSLSQLTHDHPAKQVLPPRITHTISQPQITRIQSSLNQKPPTPGNVQSNMVQPQNRVLAAATEVGESCNRILSKRSIHELVNQVGPSEKLDPEVEEILMDIADDFVESITTFGCSLAKHRKSTTLEAKDILLHLERNWNITLPGFTGDEIKSFRKPIVNDVHKERLAAIKKSVYATEATTTRNPGGQAAGNTKGVVKTPGNVFGSPNFKI